MGWGKAKKIRSKARRTEENGLTKKISSPAQLVRIQHACSAADQATAEAVVRDRQAQTHQVL